MEKKFLNLSQLISQDNIYDFFGNIDAEKILKKKTYAVWAFTNENLDKLGSLTKFKDKEIFSILGSADQAIYFLTKGARLVIGCDVRDGACFFAEFKRSAIKNLSVKEFEEIFFDENKENSHFYFEKIRLGLSAKAKIIFDYLFEGLPKNIINVLRNSGFYYKESWYFLKKKEWLPYLNEKDLKIVKKKITGFFIFNTSLEEGIKNFNKRFDLIYTSNIFDSRKYCPDPEKTLFKINTALKDDGEILITTQEDPKRIIPFLEKMGYNLTIIEPRRKFLSLFLRTYAYYYIVAKRRRRC